MTDQGTMSRRQLFGATVLLGAANVVGRGTTRAASRATSQSPQPTGQLPERGEFVVRDAQVLTMDPTLGDLPHGDLHVRDGVIVAVGTGLSAPGVTVLDGQGMIALPGFVETHWHLWTSLARNLTGGPPAPGYVSLFRRLGPHYTPTDTYNAVRLGLAEGLAAGVTTVHDWSHNIRDPAYADSSLRAHAEVGMRARFSYGYPFGHPPDQTMDLADVARVRRERFAIAGDGLTTLGVAVRGPGGSMPVVYRREWETARMLGLPVTLHVSPTRQEAERDRTIETLGREGLLGRDVLLVHPLATTAADRALIASTGTALSISPVSELFFDWDIPPVDELLGAGVLLSLSLDNTPVVGNADPFAAMRLTLGLARVQNPAEFEVLARRVLELATIDGARALGLADRVGSLTPGKRADLILLRATDLNLAPVTNPVRAVVQSAQPANVDTVIIDGRILRRDGRFVALDAGTVARNATASLAAVQVRAANAAEEPDANVVVSSCSCC